VNTVIPLFAPHRGKNRGCECEKGDKTGGETTEGFECGNRPAQSQGSVTGGVRHMQGKGKCVKTLPPTPGNQIAMAWSG